MNNTKTRTLARVTVLIAATLVVGMTFAATATTTQSAFAYQMKGAGQDARCESIQKGWLLRKLV